MARAYAETRHSTFCQGRRHRFPGLEDEPALRRVLKKSTWTLHLHNSSAQGKCATGLNRSVACRYCLSHFKNSSARLCNQNATVPSRTRWNLRRSQWAGDMNLMCCSSLMDASALESLSFQSLEWTVPIVPTSTSAHELVVKVLRRIVTTFFPSSSIRAYALPR